MCSTEFQFFLMAYSKAKLENNGNKSSHCFRPYPKLSHRPSQNLQLTSVLSHYTPTFSQYHITTEYLIMYYIEIYTHNAL